jgi:hypothetical protein
VSPRKPPLSFRVGEVERAGHGHGVRRVAL